MLRAQLCATFFFLLLFLSFTAKCRYFCHRQRRRSDALAIERKYFFFFIVSKKKQNSIIKLQLFNRTTGIYILCLYFFSLFFFHKIIKMVGVEKATICANICFSVITQLMMRESKNIKKKQT